MIASLVHPLPMQVLSEVSWDSVLLLLFEVSVFLFSWEYEGYAWHSRHWRRLQLSFVFIMRAFLNYLIFLLFVTICVVVSLGTELGNQAVTGSQLGFVSLSRYLCDTCVFSTSPEISGRCEQRTAIIFSPNRSSGGCFALGARAGGGGMDMLGWRTGSWLFLHVGGALSKVSAWALREVRAARGCPTFLGWHHFSMCPRRAAKRNLRTSQSRVWSK